MACPNCRTATLVEIEVSLQDTQVTMHSCSRCDHRWWDADSGEVLDLSQILELATVVRR